MNFVQKPQKHQPCPYHTKNHQNTEITPNTTKTLKPHQSSPKTPKWHHPSPKHPNDTNHHQNTQIRPNTTKTPKSHQTPSAILPLPTPPPKYLSRARPSQNRRACEIWVGHALQKEGPLQEKKNMHVHMSMDHNPPWSQFRGNQDPASSCTQTHTHHLNDEQ